MFLIAAIGYISQLYFLLCAIFIFGGLFALYFCTEHFAHHGGGISSWVSCGFLFLIGLALLYIGFSSILEFTSGNHSTIDSLLDGVDSVTRNFKV